MPKRQSIHDHFSAQLGLNEASHDAQFSAEDGMYAPGVLDDLEVDEPIMKKPRVEKGRRMRGPLDASLTQGMYDAVPVSSTAVDDADATNVDDIFGMLDEGEGEAAEADGIDDEEQFAAWLESRPKKRTSRRTKLVPTDVSSTSQELLLPQGATEDDVDILQQVAALRQRQIALVAPKTANVEKMQDDRAGSLRRLLDQYGQLLRVRVRLQPVVAKMVQFPQHYALQQFVSANSDISVGVDKVRTDLLAVQTRLRELAVHHEGNIAAGSDDGIPQRKRPRELVRPSSLLKYSVIEKFHASVMSRAEKVLTHWASKIVQGRQKSSKSSLQVINQPLVEQIRAITAAKTRLLGKVQRNRLHLKIFGHPDHQKSDQERAVQIAEGDFDEEIFDDGDFVRELVQHSGATSAKLAPVLQANLAKIASAGRCNLTSSKVGFHKKTKGKAINYEPRPKLVGFMTRIPQPITSESQLGALVASLFQ